MEEDNDGRFPDDSAVLVRYPRDKPEEQADRSAWPWLPGSILRGPSRAPSDGPGTATRTVQNWEHLRPTAAPCCPCASRKYSGVRRRHHRDVRRLRHRRGRQDAVVPSRHRRAELRAAGAGVPQPAHPGHRGAELGQGRADRGLPARGDAGHPVRPVHGLPGVPGQPDERGMDAQPGQPGRPCAPGRPRPDGSSPPRRRP